MSFWQANVGSAQQFFKELRRNGSHLADTELRVKLVKDDRQGLGDRHVDAAEKRSDSREKTVSILVHSIVLSSRSQVMERQIMDQKRRLTTRQAKYILEVEGANVSKEVLHDFVDILYFEDVDFSESNVLGLVQCCKQFGMQGQMLERCGDCLVKTLHLYNVVQYLELSLAYGLSMLKKECLGIIQCSKTLFQNPFLYKNISIDILSLIFTLDPLPVSEEELVDFACAWKSMASPASSVTPAKFDQLLELVRFPTLTTKYLTGPLFTSGLLSVEDQHLVMCDAINLQSQQTRKSRFSSVPRETTQLIWFESKEGKTFSVEFDPEDSFQDALQRFSRVSGFPVVGVDVVRIDDKHFDQEKLEDPGSVLGSLGIFRESRLTYRPRHFLSLEQESGTHIPLQVSASETLQQLKERLSTRFNNETYNNEATTTMLHRGTTLTTESTKLSREDAVRDVDLVKTENWPEDWRHRMVSIKFKIAARSLFGSKKDATKMSKPKIVDNLQWIAETYCKDGEHVELFLYCGGEAHGMNFLGNNNRESDWKALVHVAQFKIKNWLTGDSEMRRGWQSTAEFTPRGKCKWGYTKFIKVSKLQERAKDYVTDHGQLQFEIDFVPERIQSWF